MAGLKLSICYLSFFMQGVNSAYLNDVDKSITGLIFRPSARYHLALDSVRAIEARARCESSGGQLATIITNDDAKALKEFLKGELEGYEFWMGGLLSFEEDCNAKPFNSSCWYWDVGGEYYFYDSTLVQFTKESQAVYAKPRSVMTIVSGRLLKLSFSDEHVIRPYICDFQPSNKPAIQYFVSENLVRALDARDRCESLGGHLATLKTKEDVNELEELLSGEYTDSVFWVGGRFTDEGNCWKNIETCWYWDVEPADQDAYDLSIIPFSADTDFTVANPTSFITILPGQRIELSFDVESEYHPFICGFKSSTS